MPSRRRLISRRSFLAASAALAVTPRLRAQNALLKISPNEKVNVAVVGAGGRGFEDLRGLEGTPTNIVALCDCDLPHAAESFKKYPKARQYADWRKMLEAEKGIDAVVVSTPDHHHAIVSIAAMKLGKHVYCEKPLGRSIHEVRQMAAIATQSGVATQMGTQGHAFEGSRRAVEMIRAGAIGDVKELHVWTDRPANWWPAGTTRPHDTPPIPDGLDWDLWLGPVQERPYHPAYVPFKWRGYWDFGTGSIGDMGVHNLDTAYWALDLGLPTSAQVIESTPALDDPAMKETEPKSCIMEFQFPARAEKPPVKMTWYAGGKLPPRDLFQGETLITRDGGSLAIGTKGTLFTRTWHGGENDRNMFLLLPKKQYADFKGPEQTIPRTKSHYHEWIDACRGQSKTLSNFPYAARLTEALLIGNLALRTGKPIEWDAAKMEAANCPEAAPMIKPEFRKGWSL
ncbi:MAG: oxidoreductase domain protein [Phycisphaerales bacterium]|nr:oxidoreductase domain protein [Phycisphaerales bacterium]